MSSREETLTMYADYVAGMSLVDLSAKYYRDPTCIQKRFKRAGLVTRPVGARPKSERWSSQGVQIVSKASEQGAV